MIEYKKYKIFENLTDKEIDLFSDQIKTKSYNQNITIISEGEKGDSILFLLEGEISITKTLTLPIGKNSGSDVVEKEFGRLKSNQYISFGENSLFSSDKKRTATVKALTNCEIGFLDEIDFVKICESHYEVGYKVLKNLNEITTYNLIQTNHQILKLTTAFSLLMDN